MSGLEFHDLAGIFPLMTDEELSALTADIKEHGQLDPIITWQGKILDGRNRYRACVRLSIEPKTVEWDGCGSAKAFVVSHNLHRRHLTLAQRSILAAELATLKKGQRPDYINKKRADAQKTGSALTTEEAARLFDVSPTSVDAAKTIIKDGTGEELEAAKSGEIGIDRLARRIRANVPVKDRLKKHPSPHRARAESFRANARLWRELSDSINKISGLPRPRDMVAVARAHDRSNITDTKLLPAIEWLTEFSDAWTNSNTEANPRGKDKPAGKAKENGAATGAAGGAA